MGLKAITFALGGAISLIALMGTQNGNLRAQETTQGAATEQVGLNAWAKVFEVFSHPRCASCHVADGRPMWSGAHYGGTQQHPMYVGGDPDQLLGLPGLQCTTCHMAENAQKLHGPPGNDVWHLPPKEMAWWEKSSGEVCNQVKDPARNGDRTLSEIEDHVAHDSLVAWGWAPGPGREPAPYSASEAAAAIAAWAQAGAPCPSE